MKVCSCGHARLLHDAWGCQMRCGCGVSIVYLTPLHPEPSDESPNQPTDEELIRQGIMLGVVEDRVQESHVRVMRQRSGMDSSSLE